MPLQITVLAIVHKRKQTRWYHFYRAAWNADAV